MKRNLKLLFVLTFSLVLVACNDGDSESDGSFYGDGDDINIVVPFSPGGGADVTSRLLSGYWSEQIEGNPSFQVENIEGGGSVSGANEFAHLRDSDGYNVLTTSASTKIPYLIGESHVDFDLQDFEPIVGFPTGVVVYTSPETGVEQASDLTNPDTQLVMGATTPTAIDVMTLLALEVLDIREDIDIIFGYEGAGASRVAFEQGETNMDYQSVPPYLTNVTPLVDSGEAVPLFTLGFLDEEGNLIEDSALPELPTVEDVYIDLHGEEPSGEAWDAYLDFVGVINNFHRGFWMHNDAPEEAVMELRESAEEAVNNEEFLENAEEQLGGYEALTGEDLESAITNLESVDQSSIDFVQTFLEEEYDVNGLER